MRPIKRRRLISILAKDFDVKFVREGRGSHALYASPNGRAVIPHYEELSGILVKKITKGLDIEFSEFMKSMDK